MAVGEEVLQFPVHIKGKVYRHLKNLVFRHSFNFPQQNPLMLDMLQYMRANDQVKMVVGVGDLVSIEKENTFEVLDILGFDQLDTAFGNFNAVQIIAKNLLR